MRAYEIFLLMPQVLDDRDWAVIFPLICPPTIGFNAVWDLAELICVAPTFSR